MMLVEVEGVWVNPEHVAVVVAHPTENNATRVYVRGCEDPIRIHGRRPSEVVKMIGGER